MFNDLQIVGNLWNLIDSLSSSIRSIATDSEVDNKIELIGKTIDQFKDKLMSDMSTASTEEDMTKEEVLEIVKQEKGETVTVDLMKGVITEAMKSVFEEMNTSSTAISARLDKIESQTSGTVQKTDSNLDGECDYSAIANEMATIAKEAVGRK